MNEGQVTMTDKQIIDCEYLETGEIKFCNALNVSFYSDFLCNKGNCIILKLEQQLKAKEQECERLKKKLKEMNEVIRTETTRCSLVNSLKTELDQLKAENEELKGIRDRNFLHALEEQEKANKLKQTLTEIKPILEFYANSKMGEEQPDRTYKIMLSGGYIMAYDPKPARQALQKISEVEDG